MMTAGEKINVLIVDDSLVFREIISIGISSRPNIKVVGKVENAFDAVDKILKTRPDVIICNLEMPKMNGVEFIKKFLPGYSIPVIIISSMSKHIVDAMEAGAVDFVIKPDVQSSSSVKKFIDDLINKVYVSAHTNVVCAENKNSGLRHYDKNHVDKNRIIAIGASTGGTEAIYSILRQLPCDMPGILIVQHIPPVFSSMFSERLDSQTNLTVREAKSGDYVECGKVLIAPGDKHMRIKKVGVRYKVEVFSDQKVNGHCPSVDVLFESMADEAGKNGIGIILTGMGQDGANGLKHMRKMGARTIGQDKESSVVYGMPKVAYEIGAVEKQASLDAIPRILLGMLNKKP